MQVALAYEQLRGISSQWLIVPVSYVCCTSMRNTYASACVTDKLSPSSQVPSFRRSVAISERCMNAPCLQADEKEALRMQAIEGYRMQKKAHKGRLR